MYKMIIVDDEKIICNGLKKFINENSKDFFVIQTFYDGRDALRYIQENPVDLVLTDIKMPGISGIEMITAIRESSNDVQIIILSGFDDFAYAKKAIQYDVYSYLLKPVDNEELLRVLHNSSLKIKEHKKNCEMLKKSKELLEDMRTQFFIDLLYGSVHYHINDRISKLHFNFEPDKVKCAILKIEWNEIFIHETWKYGRIGIENAVKNFFLLETDYVKYFVLIDANNILVLHDLRDISKLTAMLRKWGQTTFHTKLYVETVYECTGIDGLAAFVSDEQLKSSAQKVKNTRCFLLNTYIKLNMMGEAKLLYSDLLDEYCLLPRQVCIQELITMFDIIKLEETPITFSELKKTADNGVTELKRVCDDCFDRLLTEYKNKHNADAELIKKIKEYIHENYYNDITLEDVSKKVYLNYVYLSRYFKQQTGERFTEYLAQVRIVNAINLLKENKYKIYEIAKMVGYKSTRYFSKQFMAFTGYMPKKYLTEIWDVRNTDDEY